MTSDQSPAGKLPKRGSKTPASSTPRQPDWTKGLQELYDSVVEEDLPDSFKDLLSKLDSKD